MNAPLYILKTPSTEDESQEESVENKVVPSSGSFLRAVDLSIFHKPKTALEVPVSVEAIEEAAPPSAPSAPSAPTVLNTLEELVQLEMPSAQAVEENTKTVLAEQENSSTSQDQVFVKPLPGFVFRLDLGQEKQQLPEAVSSLELPLPTNHLTLQNIQEVIEPFYTIPELFAYSTDTIIEAEPLERAVSVSGCTFIGSEVIAPLFSFSVPSIEEIVVEEVKTIELEIVSQETMKEMKQVKEIRELEEEAVFQQEEVDFAEVFLAPSAPSQTDTITLYEEQDDLLAPAYLITVERNTEVLAPELGNTPMIESEVSLVNPTVEVVLEAEEVKTQALELKPSFVLSQFQPSIAVQPIFKETSILMTQPEFMNKTKETEPAMVIARIARAQRSTEVNTTEKVDASEEVSATLASVAPSLVEETTVEKSGLVANTVNFFKGFAKVYRSSARKAVAPVEFMFKNAFTLTQGVMHLSVPLFMTYLLAKHVPFVSAVLEQTGNLWLNSLYMTSFYVAAATIWLTTWIAGKGLLHATKYAFYKLASIGQKN